MPEPGTGQYVQLRVYPDAEELADAAAALVADDAARSIAEQGSFSFLLSGGSTPHSVYQRLAQPAYRLRIDWAHVHFFWGDERCVPPDHADSNYRAAWESMILHLPVPGRNIHRIQAELGGEKAARLYEQEILAHFDKNRTGQEPRFDLVFLGVGEDGHTASLFPGSPVLEDGQRRVVAVQHNSPPPPLVDRVTLTLRQLNQAHKVVILVSGTGKAKILRDALEDRRRGAGQLPVQRIRPVDGELIWMADERAAAALSAGAGGV